MLSEHAVVINDQYCLYVMDNDVWLFEFPKGTIWNLIRVMNLVSLVRLERAY